MANHYDVNGSNQKPRGGKGWRIVFIISLIVFICSITALGVIAFSYFQGQQKYDSIADASDFDKVDESADVKSLRIDWDALRAINADTVGWVYVPNTPINYPIVQAKDNEYYLHVDFDGSEGWLADFGAIFLDYRNNSEFKDPSSFVYGHHLNDGSMFAAIGEMDSQERFEECRIVYLLTPQANYKLRGYSLVHCAGTEALVRTEFDDAEDMAQYIQEMMDRSEFNAGAIPTAPEITKSFAFSTCDDTYRSQGRYVLFCYVLDSTVDDINGEIGISSSAEGQADGFVNDISQN